MSSFGDDVIEVKAEKEETTMKRTEDTVEQVKGFWEEHGSKIALGASIIFSLLVNRKINQLEARTKKSFIQVADVMNPLIDNVGNLYENTNVLKSDLKTLAIHTGFQGKLACDIIKE